MRTYVIDLNDPATSARPDLRPDTYITNQFASLGVVFGNDIGTMSPWMRHDTSAAPPFTADFSGSGDVQTRPVVFARFAPRCSRVTVEVVDLDLMGRPENVTLDAQDLQGKVIASTRATISGSAVSTLTVQSSDGAIASITLYGQSGDKIGFSWFEFDVPDASAPDFGLQWMSPGVLPVYVTRGASARTMIRLRRGGGSTGPLTVGSSGSAGLTGSVSPNPIDGPDGTIVTLTVMAAGDAPVGSASVTIEAHPSPHAGSGPHSLTIPVVVRDGFAVEMLAVEITQGIQPETLPLRGADPSAPVRYDGVLLAAGGVTIVRAWPVLRTAPRSGTVEVRVVLRGFDALGTELWGSPLAAEQGPVILSGGPPQPELATLRRSTTQGATFRLPPEWTMPGSLTVLAEVHAPLLLDAAEPGDAAYRARKQLTVRGIPFIHMRDVKVWPVELVVDGKGIDAMPPQVFAEAANLFPLGTGQFHVPSTWMGQVDISSVAHDDKNRGDKGDEAAELLDEWADRSHWFTDGYLVAGVTGSLDLGVTFGESAAEGYAISVALGAGRPRSAIAHELFHMLGRVHAGLNCGAKAAESWAPDEQGLIQGVGLDRRGGLWRQVIMQSLSFAVPLEYQGPYQVLQPSQPDTIRRYYDLMSYCYQNSDETVEDRTAQAAAQRGPAWQGHETHVWTSVPGWTKMIETLRSSPEPIGQIATPLSASSTSAAPAAATALCVRVLRAADGTVRIISIAPTRRAATAERPGDLHALALDAQGATLARVAVHVRKLACARNSVSRPQHLMAVIPREASAVQIFDGKRLLAERRRGEPVQVTVHGVHHGQRVSGNSLALHWEVRAHADRRVTIDYSADGGSTWRPLLLGPDRGHARLPTSWLAASCDARLRVSISDGFDETSAETPPFISPGVPPDVRILDPVDGQMIRSDGVLALTGMAHDDHGRSIAADQLRWTVEGTHIATGNHVCLPGLSPGPARIVLEARDPAGRVACAAVEINVIDAC